MVSTPSSLPHRALVVGATGIAGSAVRDRLLVDGWPVTTLSRSAGAAVEGTTHVQADLRSATDLERALRDEHPTHVFFTAWSRQETEAANIDVNAGMLRDLLAALKHTRVEHVALMTGLKHYLGPFEAYAAGEMADTPFHEEEPRLPVNNFYYAQEDELWAAAARQGFAWSVHRAHTVVGHAVGNAMNMGSTIAVQATISREFNRPFIFPGSETQWNGVTDMTDAGLLADQMVWAASTPGVENQAYNIANGDIFRWRSMWPRLAAYFGVEPEGFVGEPRPLDTQMADAESEWRSIAEKYDLIEPDSTRLASWWHTDGDLGRNIEVMTDMSKSREAGFLGYRRTERSFTELFNRLRVERLIPGATEQPTRG
ncbi:NAD-dependent dehydratase [Cryobacterium roopkundense]|uniref:NAD-dependent dehydratase n=1 Tax=Cryobacterium roopkundense TaxID=1001240 RepID=A0A099J3N3_9MICO|nr:SDR family oxidoreductase [Cryobacterium roopkundense]KGJ72107.1 NAD-dependent dehydratase [Cryobacterium roopkundense]